MIVNEILGNLKSYDTEGKTIDTVWIDWYEQDKKLLKKKYRFRRRSRHTRIRTSERGRHTVCR